MARSSRHPSSSFKRSHLIGVSFTAGLALGLLAMIAFQFLKPQEKHATPEVVQGGNQETSTKSTADTSAARAIGVRSFQEIFNSQTVFNQNVLLYATVQSLSENELRDWWIQSQEIERKSQRETVQDAVIRKLATINPKEALRRIDDVSVFQTEALLMSVFSEWSVWQLDDAIDEATTLLGRRRNVALQAILETRDDLSASALRKIAQRLDGEETLLKLVSDAMVSQNIEAPQESWDILLTDDVDDYLQMDSLAIVAEAWREQIGIEVLSEIYHAEIEDYQIKLNLMRAIAQVDVAGALDYTQGLVDESEKLALSRLIAIEWASKDAQAALFAIKTVEPPSLASQLEISVASAWARNKPSEVIENIEVLSDEYRLDTLESAFAQIASQEPLVAIAKVGSVKNFVGNTSSIVESIVDEWSLQDPEATTDWVIQNYTLDDPERRTLLEEVLPRLAHRDPDLAFELAIEQPTPDAALGLELGVIRELAREGEVDTAKKMLSRVKANSKLFAYREVGAAMVRQSQPGEALDLRKDFEASEQELYYHYVLYTWAGSNPKNLFKSLDDLPTSSIQSRAALALIVTNKNEPILTDDQIERARDLLNSEDEALLQRLESR